jgi:alginate O-acetyltransferase complex protein AlgI
LLGLFVISGLLHEGGLSYPAWGGWGTPLLYFVLQGVLVALEVRWRVEKNWPLWLGRGWSYFWILAPLPLLFHTPFRVGVVAPLFVALHDVIARPLIWWFDLALYLAAIGHACVLIASSQVPSRLNWYEDLQKLTPFNRKIMWTYGAVIVLLIISFGLMTWLLHAEMLRGDRAALAIALLIGGFWSVRIGVDLFYFKPRDWPPGALFVVGHVLLTGLFIALACTYLSLVVWHTVF